jgi:hypothetical protein
VRNERLKVAVAEQERVPAQDAMRGDDRIDGLSHGYSPPSQTAEVLGRLDGDLASGQVKNSE